VTPGTLTIPSDQPAADMRFSEPVRVADRWFYTPALAQILAPAMARFLRLRAGSVQIGRLLIACFLFGVIIPTEIAYESELFVSRRIFGIPPHYVITAVALFVGLIADLRYYTWLLTRPVVLFGLACLLYVVALGALRHGLSSYMLRSDFYIIRWFFVGFVLMRLAITSGKLHWYMIFAAGTILFVMFALDYKSTLGHQVDTSTRRAISWSTYPVTNCGTVMISLGMMCFWPRSRLLALAFAGSYGLLFFGGAIRTSTRSLFVQQSFCLVMMLLALSRDPRMRGRGQQLRRLGVFFGVAAVVYLAWQIASGGLLAGYTQLSERFSTGGLVNDGTMRARLGEAAELLTSMTADEWILGGGLGAMFFTPLGYWTNTPHIAVLGWLQKGGVVIFLAVLYLVYIRSGVGLMAAMSRTGRQSPLPPAILVVGPPLVAWLALTFISGGLDIGSFLGIGGLTALWMQLYADEMSLRPARRQNAPNASPGPSWPTYPAGAAAAG